MVCPNISRNPIVDREVEDKVKKWTQIRMVLRRANEIEHTINLERGLVRSPARKRTETMVEDNSTTPASSSKKSRTKRVHPLLGTW